MKLPMTRTEAKMKIANLTARVLLGLGVVALLLLSVAACVPTTLEQDYGRSVHNNIAQQLANPRAGLDNGNSPTVGLPPTAALNEMERYNKSFKGEDKKQLEMKLTTPSY